MSLTQLFELKTKRSILISKNDTLFLQYQKDSQSKSKHVQRQMYFDEYSKISQGNNTLSFKNQQIALLEEYDDNDQDDYDYESREIQDEIDELSESIYQIENIIKKVEEKEEILIDIVQLFAS